MANKFVSPYQTDDLNKVYQQTALKLRDGGASNTQALTDAKVFTDTYLNTVLKSNQAGAQPIKTFDAAKKELEDNISNALRNYSVQGMTGAEKYALYQQQTPLYNAYQRHQEQAARQQQAAEFQGKQSVQNSLPDMISRYMNEEDMTDDEITYVEDIMSSFTREEERMVNEAFRNGGFTDEEFAYFNQKGEGLSAKAVEKEATLPEYFNLWQENSAFINGDEQGNAYLQEERNKLVKDIVSGQFYINSSPGMVDEYGKLSAYLEKYINGEAMEPNEEQSLQYMMSVLPQADKEMIEQYRSTQHVTPEVLRHYGNIGLAMQEGARQITQIDTQGLQSVDDEYAAIYNTDEFKAWDESDSEYYKWLQDHVYRNTMEGAQEWAEKEPKNSHARDNLYWMQMDEKYGHIPYEPDFEGFSKKFKADPEEIYTQPSLGQVLSGHYFDKLEYAPEEQQKIYRYLLHKEGKDAAYEYYHDVMRYSINDERNKKTAEYAQNLANNKNFFAQTYAFVNGVLNRASAGIVGTVDRYGSAANLDNTTNYKPYVYNDGFGIQADVITEEICNNIDWKVKIGRQEIDLFDMSYNTASSLLEMWLASKLGGGKAAAKAFAGKTGAKAAAGRFAGQLGSSMMLGASAGASESRQARYAGANVEQANKLFDAASAHETGFEYASVGNFTNLFYGLNKNTWKALVIRGLIESGEEMGTEAANIAAEYNITGDLMGFGADKKEYERLGVDNPEMKALDDSLFRIAEAGLSGFLMAGFESGGAMARNAVSQYLDNAPENHQTKKAGKNITRNNGREALKNLAMAFDEGSEAYKLGKEYNPATATAKETGKLYKEIYLSVGPQAQSEVDSLYFDGLKLDATGYLEDMGEPAENIDKVADGVAALTMGRDMTKDQYQAVAMSEHGLEVAKKLLFGEKGKNAATPEAAMEDTATDENIEEADLADEEIHPEAIKPPLPGEGTVALDGEVANPEEQANIEQMMEQPEEKPEGSFVEGWHPESRPARPAMPNGKEVALEDGGASERENQITLESRNMNDQAAGEMRDAYLKEATEIGARTFAMAYKRVMNQAMELGDMTEKARLYTGKLSKAAYQAAVESGRREAQRRAVEAAKKTTEIAGQFGFKVLDTVESMAKTGAADIAKIANPMTGVRMAEPITKGVGVRLANVTKALTDEMVVQLQALNAHGEKNGIQYRIYDTLKKGAQAFNASYQTKTNIINLSLEAAEGLITKAASHELGHYIKSFDEEGYKKLQERVIQALGSAMGYDLEGRIKEIQALYSRGGEAFSREDALEEITNEALLDFVGEEENLMQLAEEEPSLLGKIRNALSKIVESIRSAMQRFSERSKEAMALQGDMNYLQDRLNLINQAMEKINANASQAMKGAFGTAANAPAIQEYQQKIRTATGAQAKAAALTELATQVFRNTQKEWIAAHPEMEEGQAVAAFRSALAEYGREETSVGEALERAGFHAPLDGSHEMYQEVYLGKQEAMMENITDEEENTAIAEQEGEVKYSIQTMPDGTKYVEVDTDQDIFDNADPSEYRTIARDYIKEHFGGNIYGDDGIKVTSRAAKEFAYPANRRIKDAIKLPKLRASTELDKLIKASEFVNHEDDDGYHPLAVNGWNNYRVIYSVGGRLFEGITKVMLTENQPLFYDITKIKDITRRSRTVANNMPSREHDNVFDESIPEDSEDVNMRYSIQENTEAEDNTDMDVEEDAELDAQARQDANVEKALELAGAMMREGRAAENQWEDRLEGIADSVLEEEASAYPKERLMQELRKIYQAMDEKTDAPADVVMYARDLAKDVIRESGKNRETEDEGFRRIREFLQKNAITLSSEMKAAIKREYGSLINFQRKNEGKIRITNNGKYKLEDIWYGYLQQIAPEVFQNDVADEEMPRILDAYMEKMQGMGETALALNIVQNYFQGEREMAAQSREMQQIIADIRAEYEAKYERRLLEKKAQEELDAYKTDLQNRIKKELNYLNSRYYNETDLKNIPEKMKGMVGRLITPFLRGEKGVFEGWRLQELRTFYAEMEKGDSAHHQFDPTIMQGIQEMEKTIKGKRLSQMTMDELETMHDLISNLRHMVDTENRIFLEGRNLDYTQVTENEMAHLKGRSDITPAHEKASGIWDQNRRPISKFKQMGGAFYSMFRDLQNDQDTYAFDIDDAEKFFRNAEKEHHVNEWIYDTPLDMETERGERMVLTKQQAMTLHALWQRETENRLQKGKHLMRGGAVYAKNAKQIKGVDMKGAKQLTEKDMKTIRDYLGIQGIAFANAMVKYLSETVGEKGNETSMKLYGIRKFTEKYYFPYDVDKNFVFTDFNEQGNENGEKLKHFSATKRLTKGASNPVVIDNFTDMWANHVHKMALYHSFVPTLDNMNRIMNYKAAAADGTQKSMRAEIARVYGEGTVKYIRQFMQDVNGGVTARDDIGRLNKLISRFKKSAVAMNLSTVLKQPVSIARAMALINPMHFANISNPVAQWKEIRSLSGVAILKDIGRFDTGTGRSAREYMTGALKSETLREKADKVNNNVTGYLPASADKFGWGILWAAVKREARHNGVDIGTPEGKQQAVKRFEEVVEYTQVYDSVLSKTQLMRSSSALAQMITAFGAESAVSANLLADSIFHAKDTNFEGRVTIRRAAAVYVVNALLLALAGGIIGAGRDDDEEKTWLEKFAGKYTNNFLTELNPMNMLPIARDIVSMMEGYEVERTDMALIGDLITGANVMLNPETSTWDKIEKGLGSVANLFGIPLENVMREGRSILNIINSKPLSETSTEGLKYSVLEGIPDIAEGVTSLDKMIDVWPEEKKAYYGRMTDAYLDGDEAEFGSIKEYMMTRKGDEVKEIKTGIKKATKEKWQTGQITNEQAIKILRGIMEYNDNEIYFTLDEWLEEWENSGTEGYSYSKYNDFFEAVESGRGLKAAANDLMNHGVERGSISSAMTSRYKERYIQLYKTDKSAAATMERMLLDGYVAIGYDRNTKKKDIQNWVK